MDVEYISDGSWDMSGIYVFKMCGCEIEYGIDMILMWNMYVI